MNGIGLTKTAELLIEGHAPIDQADTIGRTALHYGAEKGNTDVENEAHRLKLNQFQLF